MSKQEEFDAKCKSGVAAYKADRFEDAKSAFEEALLLHPRGARARAYKALCHYDLGEKETALTEVQDALRTSPQDAFPNWVYGYFLLRLGKPNQALEHLLLAYQADQSVASYAVQLGECYIAIGEEAKAAEIGAKAKLLHPNDKGVDRLLEGANSPEGIHSFSDMVRASRYPPQEPDSPRSAAPNLAFQLAHLELHPTDKTALDQAREELRQQPFLMAFLHIYLLPFKMPFGRPICFLFVAVGCLSAGFLPNARIVGPALAGVAAFLYLCKPLFFFLLRLSRARRRSDTVLSLLGLLIELSLMALLFDIVVKSNVLALSATGAMIVSAAALLMMVPRQPRGSP